MSIANTLVFIVVIFGGGIAGQIALSRLASKWPGLMLPTVTFLFALFSTMGVITQFGSSLAVFMARLVTFAWANIPTAILLVIYFLCRRKYRKQAEMSKMNLQDLDEL